MLEHGPECNLWRRILPDCEKSPGQESCDLYFFVLQNTQLFLECGFVLLPGVADRTELTSAVVIHMPFRKSMFLPYVTCLSD